MPGLNSPEVRAFAESVAAVEELRQVAAHLSQSGIPLMPLKGVLLQRLYYSDPRERRVTDLDVLVRPPDFARAIESLKDAGYREETANTPEYQVVLRRAGAILAVDLHRHLFECGRYRVDTGGIFRRASEDGETFGFPVQRMDERDLYAHLVGKVASDHLGWLRPEVLEDLRRIGAEAVWSATAHGEHLNAMGLGRAARYALGLIQRRGGDPFAAEVRDSLPADPMGVLLARIGIGVTTRDPLSPWAKLSGVLLATSLRDSLMLGLDRVPWRR